MYRNSVLKMLVVATVLLILPVSTIAQQSSEIQLTEEERAWIGAHPTLVVGNEQDWAPFNYVEDGQSRGYSIGVIRLIAQKVGLQIETVSDSGWTDLLRRFRDGEIDVMPAIFASSDRRPYADFTAGYRSIQRGIVVDAKQTEITDIASLQSKRVAVMTDYVTSKTLLSAFPNLQVVEVNTNLEGIQAVARGDADAYVTSIVVAQYLTKKYDIDTVEVLGTEGDSFISTQDVRMAVAKGNTILLGILNKGLASISVLEQRELNQSWMPSDVDVDIIPLSKMQQKWIEEHPVIRIGVDPAFGPYSFMNDDGELVGVAPDFIEVISRKLGIEFEIVSNLAWADIVDSARSRGLDGVATIVRTPERLEFLGFTPIYIPTPLVIMTGEDMDRILTGQDLNGLKVATVRGYSTSRRILDEQPGIIPFPVDTPLHALQAVADGDANAYVGVLGVVLHETNVYGISGLKVAGSYDLETHGQRFAIRNDWPELTLMLNQAIDSISELERTEIFVRWIPTPDFNPKTDYTLLLESFAIFLLILGVMTFYVRKLGREINLRKAAESESTRANAAKSVFLANMSHEIRTPLNAIIGTTDLLQEKQFDAEVREYATMIHDSGEMLLAIVEDILDFSRIEANKVELEPSWIDPRQCIEQSVAQIRGQAVAKRLDVKLSIAENLPESVFIDCPRLQQVLVNLLGNAVKFTEQGSVSLHASVADLEGDALTLQISIIDTGIGIARTHLGSLFDAFERAKRATHDALGGSGLGLAISKQLITMMNGKISIESTLGTGTAVHLAIPLTAREVKSVSYASDATDSFTRPVAMEKLADHMPMRILVTDDNSTNRRLLCRMLETAGYEPDEAADGEQAVAASRTGKYDLIFMDVRMPGMSGLEATRQIRQQTDKDALKIIAVTGDATVETRDRCFSVGVDDYLTKPFRLADLRAILQQNSRSAT